MIDPIKVNKHLEWCIENKQDQPLNSHSDKTMTDFAKMAVETVVKFNEEIINHKHELVIDGHSVVRLDDVYDGEEDYYWIYNKWVGWKGMDEEQTGEYHSSCVGHHTLLKGFIPDKEYENLVKVWNYNNFVKAV